MYCSQEDGQQSFQRTASCTVLYNREKQVQHGTAPCFKGTPDVKIHCKTVTILFINTAAKQGKRPLATYSP